MIDSTGTGSYAIMATCKYYLPCGYCELKKRICTADNPMTVTPTWEIPQAVPTEVTCSAERKEE